MTKTTPAPDEVVWWHGIRWVQAVRMQADRFERTFYEWEAAVQDADFRRSLNEDTEHARSWRDSEDKQEIGRQPVRVPTRLLAWLVATDRDFLLVAVRNLLRAQNRLPEHLRTAMTGEEEMMALRNLAEHFDDEDGPAAQTLRGMPHIKPGAIAYTGKELWIGGDDGVPLSRIRAWAIRVWKALADALTETGIEPLTEPGESIFEGDDELPWPTLRLRYSWNIPHVPEEEWPSERMPEEVGDLLAEKFRRLRDRDPYD